MEQTRIEAFKREFPLINNCLLNNVDSIKVRRLDSAKLKEKMESKNLRDSNWNLPAGDSYNETSIFIYDEIDENNSGIAVSEGDSILDTVIKNKLLNIELVVEMTEEGGFGCSNPNEFGYGNEKHITIYKKAKFEIPEFVEGEIKKAVLEVKREADF